MNKRFLLILLPMLMLSLSCIAKSRVVVVDGIKYEIKKDNTAVAIGSVNDITDIIIRPYVTCEGKEYRVTAIAALAFGSSTVLKIKKIDKVVIPEGIVSIGRMAFFSTSITEIDIPNSVKEIGPCAFDHCRSLVKVVFPDTPCRFVVGKGASNTFCASNNIMEIRGHNELMPQYLISMAVKDKNLSAALEGIKGALNFNNMNVASNAYGQPAQQMATPQSVSQPAQSDVPQSDIDVDIPKTGMVNENMFAFIIANENYKNVQPVEFALNDGRLMAKYCQQTLGIPEDNIKTYYDATLNNINAAVRAMGQIGEAYKGDASFIVYYAGHGVPDESNGSSFLLPVDGEGSDPETGYGLKKFYDKLSAVQAKSVTIFLDACFSGALRGNGMLVAARGVAIKAKAESPKGKMVVISAAQSDETAYPYKEKGHGMFTYFLLKKIQESQGTATLGELSDYVSEQVSRRSIVKNNKSQTPSTQVSPSVTNEWKEWRLK